MPLSIPRLARRRAARSTSLRALALVTIGGCALALTPGSITAVRAQSSKSAEFVPTFSTSAHVKQQLDKLTRLQGQKLWDDWLNTYQELVDDPRDLVLTRDEEFLVGVRAHCHQLLAALPPTVRQRYRALRDADAKRIYDKALAEHDRVGMREVFERYRFTSFSTPALQWLAARSLDEGQPELARAAYARLVKDSGSTAPTLLRYALAADAAGKPAEARAALDRVRKEFGALPLEVGGQKITGAAAAERFAKGLHPVPASSVDGWSSFAGPAGTRQQGPSLSGPLKKLWAYDYPTTATGPNANFSGVVLVTPNRQRFSLLSFPTVAGDRVWVQGPRNVSALNRATGARLWDQEDWTLKPEETPRNQDAGAAGFRGYGGRGGRAVQAVPALNGRLLITRMPLRSIEGTWPTDFAIAAIDTQTGKQVWRRVGGGEVKTVFYNSPIVVGNVIYTGTATFKGGITEFNAVALNASTGETLWTTYLGAGSDPFMRTDGSPAAVRDGLVWIESPLYSLNAVDALTGEVRLIYHYTPERRATYQGSFDYGGSLVNEPISLVVAGTGPVVFAPRWGTDLIAIDPATLKLLWSSPKGPGGNTMGSIFAADEKRVYVCGDYLQAISLADGAREWGWDPQVPGVVGFAALAGDRIYVPIESKIHVRSAVDGHELEVLDTAAALGESSGMSTILPLDRMLLVGTPERLVALGPG